MGPSGVINPAPNQDEFHAYGMLGAVLLGWVAGVYAGLMVYGTVLGNFIFPPLFMLFFGLHFTWPALLIRAVMKHEWGVLPAVAVGAVCGPMSFVYASVVVFSEGPLPGLKPLSSFLGPGAVGGAVWWCVEAALRNER